MKLCGGFHFGSVECPEGFLAFPAFLGSSLYLFPFVHLRLCRCKDIRMIFCFWGCHLFNLQVTRLSWGINCRKSFLLCYRWVYLSYNCSWFSRNRPIGVSRIKQKYVEIYEWGFKKTLYASIPSILTEISWSACAGLTPALQNRQIGHGKTSLQGYLDSL